MGRRIVAFDIIKLIAIYLVIVGHCTQHLLSSFEYEEPVYLFIYSFHMPLFMFLSGFFSCKEQIDKKIAWVGVKKRFSQLIIPCIIATFLHLLLLAILMNDVSIITQPTTWRNELYNTLWFLKSLFICYVIYVTISLFPMSLKIVVTLLFLLMIPFVGYFRLSLMLPSFLFGVFARKYDIFQKTNVMILFISAPLFLTCLHYWSADSLIQTRASLHGLLNGNFSSFFHYLYVLLTGFSGTLLCCSFYYWLIGRIGNSVVVQRISTFGRYTLGIYIIQTFLLETILSFYVKLDIIFSPVICNTIIIPILSFGILISCILLVKLICKNKSLSFLLLGYSN